MKNYKKLLCIILALAMTFLLLAGCGTKTDDQDEPNDSSESGDSTVSTGDGSDPYADVFDENGYFKGVKALDYVEMFNYQAMEIPSEVHVVTEEQIQSEIEYIMDQYSSGEQITDRAVADGDTVNIDYTGTVNDIKFEGGSTNGMGTEVTIGVTEYIDDFLEQLIGHMPGDTIDVNVKFPDDYGEETLQGKDALFVTTINFIVDAELTDEYVAENLSPQFGWFTVEEMHVGLRLDLEKYNVQQYIRDYFANEVSIKSVPDQLITYQENTMLSWYQGYAEYNGVSIEEIISSEGFSSIDELIEGYYDTNVSSAANLLVILAVAEDMRLILSDDDLTEYFFKYEGTGDYSTYVEQFGLPYVKHNVICQTVIDNIVQNAILL